MHMPASTPGSLTSLLEHACLLEATAPKIGNVHPAASFPGLSYQDFVESAHAAAPELARAGELGVGTAILQSIRATRKAVQTNTNLGIVLLLAPLAAVPPGRSLAAGIPTVLRELSVADAVAAYQAICLAEPGGLGQTEQQDIQSVPTVTLLEAMRLAETRDLIARQYTTDFAMVLDEGTALLRGFLHSGQSWPHAIVQLQLTWLGRYQDSLIGRKHGPQLAETLRRRCARIQPERWPVDLETRRQVSGIDNDLRAHRPRINPGTIADLICATIFGTLRDHADGLPSVPAVPGRV